MATYLVTGSSGFIASYVIEHLLKLGQKVIGVDKVAPVSLKAIDYPFIQGDLCNEDFCFYLCKGVDYVLHYASLTSVNESVRYPKLYLFNNLISTIFLLNSAKRFEVKLFVFASSSAVYGDEGMCLKKEEHRLNPSSPYASDKVACEYYLKVFTKCYDLPTVSLRYFNVFGNYLFRQTDYSGVIPRFLHSCQNGLPLYIFGDGEQIRDFIFVEDVAYISGMLDQFPCSVYGEAINIGTGIPCSINHLATMIGDLLGEAPKRIYRSERVGDIRYSVADISKLKTLLPSWTTLSLEQGLQRMIEGLS